MSALSVRNGLTWTDIVKVNKRMTDFETMTLKEYFGDWTSASTALCINQFFTQGAHIEL